MNLSLVKRPSAFLPVAMSLIALAMVPAHVAIFGFQHNEDEGAAAHIFQLLMVFQAPIILLFAMKWLPREPRQTLMVLALQIGAACAALGTLFFFEQVLGAV
jgi:hypothetical protein